MLPVVLLWTGAALTIGVPFLLVGVRVFSIANIGSVLMELLLHMLIFSPVPLFPDFLDENRLGVPPQPPDGPRESAPQGEVAGIPVWPLHWRSGAGVRDPLQIFLLVCGQHFDHESIFRF